MTKDDGLPDPLEVIEDEVVGVDAVDSPGETVTAVDDTGVVVMDAAEVVAALIITAAEGGLATPVLLTGGMGAGFGILVSYNGLRTPPTKVLVF